MGRAHHGFCMFCHVSHHHTLGGFGGTVRDVHKDTPARGSIGFRGTSGLPRARSIRLTPESRRTSGGLDRGANHGFVARSSRLAGAARSTSSHVLPPHSLLICRERVGTGGGARRPSRRVVARSVILFPLRRKTLLSARSDNVATLSHCRSSCKKKPRVLSEFR